MQETKRSLPKDSLKYICFTCEEQKAIQNILDEFYIAEEDHVNTIHKSLMILVGSSFIHELTNYYNKDVSLNASICKSIKYGSTDDEKLKYYLELFYTKLIACWEYLFSYMNEYLKTELVPNEQIKKEIIEKHMYKLIPIQHDNYVEMKKISYSPDEQKQIREYFRKKLIVLTPDRLKQKIGEIYEKSELINNVFNCYSDNLVTEAKHIRNLIVHSDSLQKSFAFGVDDFFRDTAICSRDAEYFPKLISQIDNNMQMLKKALLLFKEMVIDDKIPNHIENAGKKYKTYDYKCNVCNSEYFIPDILGEYFMKHISCSQCKSKKFSKVSENQVSELFYGTCIHNLMDEWGNELL